MSKTLNAIHRDDKSKSNVPRRRICREGAVSKGRTVRREANRQNPGK